jgi:1,2-diacylglycerol 3-alpha-glucosyltransferase
MRIGMFADSYLPDINGVVTSIVTLKRALENDGHEVFIITTHPSLIHTSYEDRILRLPGIEVKQMYGYVATAPLHFKAYSIVKEMKLDIIHVHTEFGAGIFGHFCGKMLKLPIVSTYHTTYEDYTHYVNVFNSKTVDVIAKKTIERISRLYGASCEAIIAPSQKTKDMLLRYNIQRPIFIVPTGLDLERFDPHLSDPARLKEIRDLANAKENEKVILFVGRIAKEKSIDFVIDGFRYIKERGLPVKFLIVGGGPEMETLVEKVDFMNLKDTVVFVGKKPAEQVPAFYHASDAFVSASLTETQGMTYIEALASQLPVFARPDDVLTGLVEEGKNGYFFRSPQEFAQRVEEWLSIEEDRRLQMRLDARKQVDVYDMRSFSKAIAAVYQMAIERYTNTYRIESVMIKDEIAEISASNRTDKFTVTMLSDVCLARELVRGKMVSEKTWEDYRDDEKVAKAYQAAIRKLAVKDRTKREITDFLNENTDCTIVQINAVIGHLLQRGYLDDLRYTHSMVLNLRSLLMGKNRIIKTLKEKGIEESLINEAFSSESQDNELNLAIRWAEKIQPTIGGRSLMAKKQKIRQKLLLQGYESTIADQAMTFLSFENELVQEKQNLFKAALKAANRLSRKFTNQKELRMAIKKALATQGFKFSDINEVVEEMELENESKNSE